MADYSDERQERAIRLVSIVAIDVVGFSAMSERDHRKAAKAIEMLRARIERVAEAHEGRLFNTAGDGFMLEFGSAGAALAAIQELLDKRGKGEPPIRVGAHVGDVVVTAANDLLGHGVNVAARLQALAGPGAALVSAEFRSMAHSSPTAAFQARGRQPLENIEQKVQTFEILSRRQRFVRFVRQVGSTAIVLGLIALALYFSPAMYRALRHYAPGLHLPSFGQIAPAEPSAEAATTVSIALPPTPTPALHPGQALSDCAACPEMIVAPGSSFVMGSPADEAGRAANEGPRREVRVAPFAVSKYEITFAQWDACVAAGGCNGFTPSDRGWGRGQMPVIGVSWTDARAYVDWLNHQLNGPRYRLLSEAEWEFVARAGGRAAYAFGPRISAQQATFRARRTTAVGAHPANGFQVFDMSGNAAEWVEDCYAPNYQLAPIDGAAVEADECMRRVYRGGGFADAPALLRAAARNAAAPSDRAKGLGFRVARSL